MLKKLKKKTDIENCSNASPFFGDLLREKREREMVLPTIFGILARRYCDEENKDESYKETDVESIPWQRPAQSEKPHRMTPIWKCRLVCKKWNKAIEEIHQNEDTGHYQMANDFYKAKNYQRGRKWGTDRFEEESKVVEFLEHFVATHYSAVRRPVSKKCPFLGRFVEVACNLYVKSKQQAYFNRLMEMFDKFGDQVWYVKFCWWYRKSVLEHVEIYKKMKQMLEQMPNLKVLRISYHCFPSKEDLADLEEEIQRNPFPGRTNLEMISVDQIPGLLCNHLVNQNPQISRLEICNTNFKGKCYIFLDKLPNLSQLGLVGVDYIEIFEAFESNLFTPNLEKFYFRCTPMFPVVPWSRVFNAINSKLNADYCTDLQLRMSWPSSDAERMTVLQNIFECRLELVNIQRCQIIWYTYFFSGSLRNPIQTLREIDITPFDDLASKDNNEEEELREKQVIKFLGIEEKMELSIIAKELSRMKKLRVSSDENKKKL